MNAQAIGEVSDAVFAFVVRKGRAFFILARFTRGQMFFYVS